MNTASHWRPIEGNWRVTVHREDGHFWAEVHDMPGAFASGDTMEELIEALTESIAMYLSSKNVEVTIRNLRLIPVEGEHETDGQYRLVPA